jgi:hypothetical protein
MESSREPPAAPDVAPQSVEADNSAAAGSDATVISVRPPGGPATMAEVGRMLEGTDLGPYHLEKFVGGGGMGAVFRALDTTLDRIVAVKVLSHQQSGDEEMLRRFRNEAQSAARLDHENIGRVYAVGSEGGWHYIVFEFIEGTNLRDVVTSTGPFDVARTINVAIQIADALEHAADRDVVHRDIKPSNIIITPAGRARLVDMGLARLHQVADDQDLTVSGMTLGTFDYISPEQARDPRLADVRSDLYSLGCTIFYMLVGKPPFAQGTMVQKLLQHQQDSPPAIESLRPDVPRQFAAVLDRLMAKDPKDRPQRPAELIADLLGIADTMGIDVTASRPAAMAGVETVVPPVPRSFAANLPWIVPLCCLMAIVLSLWWLSSRSRLGGAAERSPDAAAMEIGADEKTSRVEPEAASMPWRVVEAPAGARETATLGEAVRRAATGDTIELAYDGFRDESPLVVAGRQITLRAAEGFEPGVRFVPVAAEAVGAETATASGLSVGPVGPVAIRRAGCTIASGTLSIERVQILLARSFVAGDGGAALFAIESGGVVACDNVAMELPSNRAAADGPRDVAYAAGATAVFVRVVGAETETLDSGEGFGVRMVRSSAVGDGVFLDVAGTGRLEVSWSGGRCVTPRQFLVAEGAGRGVGDGMTVRLSLNDGLFACREGFACLLDSSARPLLTRLQVFANQSWFVVAEGRPLLQQSGTQEPDRYQTAIEWLDANSRYEGSGIFRWIDGSAERVEIDFAAFPQPLLHSPRITAKIEGWNGVDPSAAGDP